MASKTLKEAIENLYQWQYNRDESFNCMLYTLFNKADAENYGRLKAIFPVEALALKMLNDSLSNGIDLFKTYGLIKERKCTKKNLKN